ncbi:MAG: tetratricopeptide repeat protein, partial [Cyanobacteria bacterium J06558_2]
MAKKKKEKKSKTLTRIVTLLIGLGFVGSTVAIAVGSFFSQNNRSAADADNLETAPSIEEQIQLQARGYEKVLEREPKNLTALNGL